MHVCGTPGLVGHSVALARLSVVLAVTLALGGCKLSLVREFGASDSVISGASVPAPPDLTRALQQIGAGAGSTLTVTKILQTTDNTGYWVAGTSTASLGGTLQGVRGSTNGFVMKLDPAGNLLWTVEYGPGPGDGVPYSSFGIERAGPSDVYVYGYCTSGFECDFGGTLLNSVSGGDHALLSRVAADGTILYTSEIRGIGGFSYVGLRLGADELTPYLYGSAWGGAPSPDNTCGGTSGNVAFIARIDAATGAKVWLTRIGPSNMNNNGWLPVVDSAGNVYLAGYVSNFFGATTWCGATIVGTRGDQDAVIAKLNSSGAVQWAYQYGAGAATYSSFEPGGWSLTGGNFVVGGYTGGVLTGSTQLGTHSAQDPVLASFSPAGAVNWINQIGAGAGNSSFTRQVLAVPLSGGPPNYRFIVIGQTNGTLSGATQYGADGALDAFIAAIDDDGTQAYASQLGATAANMSVSGGMLLQSTPGDFILVGTLGGSAVIPGSTQVGSHGTTDAVLARFDSTGAMSWVVQIGGGAGTTIGSQAKIMEGPSDRIFWAGTTTGDLGGTLYGALGAKHVAVAAFDPSGAHLWSTQTGASSGHSELTNMVIDPAGSLRVAGTTAADLGASQVGGAPGTQSGFTLKLDPASGEKAP